MSDVWIASLGSQPGDPGWRPVGTIGDLTGIRLIENSWLPDDKMFVAQDQSLLNRSTATMSISFTASPETIQNFMYILRKAEIIADLRRIFREDLQAMADRFGIDYKVAL